MVALDVDASSHTVHQALWLFEDFLQHEVLVAAFLYLAEVDVNRLHLQFLLLAENAYHLEFFSQTNNGDVAVLQIDYFVRIVYDRTCV